MLVGLEGWRLYIVLAPLPVCVQNNVVPHVAAEPPNKTLNLPPRQYQQPSSNAVQLILLRVAMSTWIFHDMRQTRFSGLGPNQKPGLEALGGICWRYFLLNRTPQPLRR